MPELKTPPKITVKIWMPIWIKFNKKVRDACLRRDAFLIKVLQSELPYLDSEVSLPNSPEALAYVESQLDAMDRRIVSLALPSALSAELNTVLRTKRISRDAFFNRLFLLLAAEPKFIDSLWFRFVGDPNWRAAVWSEFKHEGPFFERGFYPLEPAVDPLWGVRTGLQVFNEDAAEVIEYREPETGRTVRVQRGLLDRPEPLTSIYTLYFDQKVKDPKRGEVNLAALNCYVPDWLIPGHEAQRAHQAELDELLSVLQ